MTETVTHAARATDAIRALPLRKAIGVGKPEEPKRRHMSFVDVIEQWRKEGEIVRIPTGIVSLDKACGGGLPLPRRILIIGAPSAGKTYTEVWLANKFAFDLAKEGFRVAVMAIDEDSSDVTARFAQMRGFTPEEIESRDPAILDRIEESLQQANVRLYDGDWLIEAVVTDLVSWAKETESKAVLCVDSIHAARSIDAELAITNKSIVDANCKALETAHERHGVTVIATGEMARGHYASEKFAQDATSIAAAADSRKPEYFAQTLLKLTTPKDCPDTVRVEIAKNRGPKNQKGVTFWLQLDRETHDFHEVGDPDSNPEVVADRKADKVAEKVKANAVDALDLAKFLTAHKGLNDSQLRNQVSAEPTLGWGTGRLRKALTVLENGGCSAYSHRTEKAGTAVLHFVEVNQ